MTAATLPPGPKGTLLGGNLAELRRDPLALYTRCAREFGDFSTMRFGLRRVYLINHPDLIESVLVTNARNWVKHYALKMNRLLLGDGLLTSDGDAWLRQRRLLQPLFNRDRLAGYGAVMVERTERLADSWHDGETRDIHSDMTHLALDIIARSLFGSGLTEKAREIGGVLSQVGRSFNRRLGGFIILPEYVPTPTNLRMKRAVRRLDEILYDLIGQRKESGGQDDLLSVFLNARHEDGGRMSDRQLRDEAMTLFLAGHDTTALTLSWCWYLLAQNPPVYDALQAELASVLGARPPTPADLPRLPYTERVVMETMRLYPAAYMMGRQAVAACDLGGHRLPAGATVLMAQWLMHRDKRWFDEPERFHPDRWADGLAKRLPKFAYFPFGGGGRLCIGNSFALMEACLVLATLARRCRFSLVPGPPIRPAPAITLKPEGGIPVVVRLTAQRGAA
ncbi:MAG TPA: cytochrome P450 [Gemmataceae bacterium]|nr:cytochrome P450 [Gemmataceae bacterium]